MSRTTEQSANSCPRSNTICCIYNSGPHYRWPIFKALADNFDIDFCFGANTVYTKSIKTFDYDKLPGFTRLLRNRRLLGKFYWQSGALRQVFKPYRQYILLGEAYCASSWVILLFARLLRKRTICWTHGWYGRESGAKRLISSWFYGMFDEILTYNDYARRLLIAGGLKADKIGVIGNSLDSARHKAMRPSLCKTDIYRAHFNNSLPTLLYCGRIQKIKQLNLLIDAAALLKSEDIDVNIALVGKDSEDVGLDKMVEQAGIVERVWFYGPCYDENKLGELFYNAAACVSPGNVGLTAVHALSFGCPVITHDDFTQQMPEFECIKPGVTGDFFHQGDAADLAKVIKRWLAHSEEQRAATARAAFAEIDARWNVDYQITVFKSVLG